MGKKSDGAELLVVVDAAVGVKELAGKQAHDDRDGKAYGGRFKTPVRLAECYDHGVLKTDQILRRPQAANATGGRCSKFRATPFVTDGLGSTKTAFWSYLPTMDNSLSFGNVGAVRALIVKLKHQVPMTALKAVCHERRVTDKFSSANMCCSQSPPGVLLATA
ncbi:unnamed protein product [Peronospora belbahrii]|uniref:Uncharacterized protein n=1 Tax=Peronospora belbahrii TaxID=622444 RepID=A0AAU9L3F1_9STRA|nr:unnamed protein product [Peronospora belbahrii]